MKKKVFFGILMFLIALISEAQIQDLAGLSKGEMKEFKVLYKQNQVFGYFVLYDLGEISDTIKKFEYILMDKNLNKSIGKEFEAENTIETYNFWMNFKDEIVLSPYVNNDFSYRKSSIPKSKRINVKTNDIYNKQNQCYENNTFFDCPDDKTMKERKKRLKEERKQKGFVYDSYVSELKYRGYLVSEFDEYEVWGGETYTKNNSIIRFDESKKELWRLKYNADATQKKYENYKILDLDSQYVYFLHTYTNKEEKEFKIEILDLNTGVIKQIKTITEFNKETLNQISNISNQYNITNDEDFDDKYVLSSALRDKHYKQLGYFRLIIDKKTLNIDFKTFTFDEDVSKFIEDIDKYGGVERGFNLEIRDVLFFKDGSIAFVTEKFKLGTVFPSNQLVPKTTDMVVIITDENFKLKEVKVLPKDKSNYSLSDYLFNQYLNNKNDIVFYYRDYQKDENKDKNWNLFINTIINGKFNQEKIQISSKQDKYLIYPYPAKDGYILFFEYNKKDKYNQIRLEKLNY